MNSDIRERAKARGITRLCHFTPSRNLMHIASGTTGVLATGQLKEEERAVFTQTDLQRLDGCVGHISCSIEYPNAWFLDKARAKDSLFRDWVILFISPHHLWRNGARFCPRNAAASYGALVGTGFDAFEGLFADGIQGAGSRVYQRATARLACCPTDEQAEVLVPDQILPSDIKGIAVASSQQAHNEAARFRLLRIQADRFPLIIAPALFDPRALHRCLEAGQRPEETIWREERE